MKNIIFIAPPASGKGTQSALLMEKYGYVHISTGDLLRDEVQSKSDLGIKLENIMKSGELVSDEIVTLLLKNKLSVTNEAFILDGYPRNIKQAEILDNLLNELNKKIDVVIYLDLDVNEALNRVLGRMVCPKCGRSYHKTIEGLKPKMDLICDDDNSTLIVREDDNAETFKIRFETYLSNTKPLIDYYTKKGLLIKVDGRGNSNEIFESIEGIIND